MKQCYIDIYPKIITTNNKINQAIQYLVENVQVNHSFVNRLPIHYKIIKTIELFSYGLEKVSLLKA